MSESEPHPLSRHDQTLLDQWAQEFLGPLKAYFLRRVTSHAQAEELAQEVFVRLALRGDLETIETIRGYIFTTARRVLSEHQKKRASRRADFHLPFFENEHLLADSSPEVLLTNRQMLKMVLEGLRELPEKTRNIFILYHFEDEKQMAIAIKLGIGLRTVERHLALANTHLVKKLGSIR